MSGNKSIPYKPFSESLFLIKLSFVHKDWSPYLKVAGEMGES